MNTLSSFTLYIVLATIIPGFITISLLLSIYYTCNNGFPAIIDSFQEGLLFIVAFAIVFVNQILGIALEKLLYICDFFPKENFSISLPVKENENSFARKSFLVNPKSVYKEMYVILSGLGKNDDSHGHVQRIVGQFFLTLNSLVSYILSTAYLIIIVISHTYKYAYSSTIYTWLTAIIVLATITLLVVRARFKTMIEALYTARHMSDINLVSNEK